MPEEFDVEDFDLALTLASGQFFRYYQEHDAYLLLTTGKALRLRQKSNIILYDGADISFVKKLFSLDTNYQTQLQQLHCDAVLSPIIHIYPGLRVMRQDLHEAIIGFLCSSQSNIPKIKMNLHLLSQSCGESIDGYSHLPQAGTALDPSVVRNAKTGYRAKFIVATNLLLNKKLLDDLQAADYETSHALLCDLPGIGPKIADCVCLFALGHGEAFPVDVHIMRAMRTLFPRSRLTSEDKVKKFAQTRWGKNAGLAQQFIFQWARDSRNVLIKAGL